MTYIYVDQYCISRPNHAYIYRGFFHKSANDIDVIVVGCLVDIYENGAYLLFSANIIDTK